jgi:hypothetical protein
MVRAELLRALLSEGWVDRREIQDALNRSPQYARPESEPAWQRAWRGWELRDEAYEEAVSIVEQQSKDMKFLVLGEILHVFGLRLMFSDIGVIGLSRADVVHECKEYTDRLEQPELLPDPMSFDMSHDWKTSWEGLGFSERDSEEFGVLAEYYYSMVQRVMLKRLPEAGRKLLSLLARDPNAYFRQLCANNVEASPYYDIPVLAAIPAKDFVKHVTRLEPEAQRVAFRTFKGRYEHGLLNGPLKSERAWLQQIKDEFEEVVSRARPLSKRRLRIYLQQNVAPFLTTEDTSARQ